MQNSVTGETYLDPALVLALLLVIVGLGFKMAAVPFHFWTPDAYDGAATPVTAFMSVVPKVAAFAATIRILVQALGPLRDDWVNVIAVLALVTMAFGNIVAIAQRNVKRMLAYSSIAHTGYMMVGLAAYRSTGGFLAPGATPTTGDTGITSLLTYLLAYAVMNIGAFAVVTWVQHRGRGMTLDDYNGLAASEPLAAAALTVFLISLMGIPPTIGFYAKYQVIVAAIEIGPIGLILALAIVVLSAVMRLLLPAGGGGDVLQCAGARAAAGEDRTAERRHRRDGDCLVAGWHRLLRHHRRAGRSLVPRADGHAGLRRDGWLSERRSDRYSSPQRLAE